MRHFLLWATAVLLTGCGGESSIAVEKLQVEYLKKPIGIDRPQPILGWQLASEENGKYQSAYQILVASDEHYLNKLDADLLNSGKVTSSQTQHIVYDGKEPQSGQQLFWKVRIWDEKGQISPWSDVASWQMGLLKTTDWKAKWISNKYAEVSDRREPFNKYDPDRSFVSVDTPAVYMRKAFQLKEEIKKATAHISGLGYYELYLNGEKVGDRVLDPAFTDYQKRVKYASYDVTGHLKGNAENVAAVVLGNGFYNHQEKDLFQMEKANWKTPPKLLCQIEIEYDTGETASLTTDATWKWSYGPIVYNSIRGGETIDARIDFNGWNTVGFDDRGWEPVSEVPPPVGKLSYQYMPPLRETKSFAPIKSWSPKKNVTVFDFGENMTGYTDLTLQGQKDKVIDIYFNEALNADSTLNIKYSSSHTWGRFQHGRLIASGGQDRFEPRFTYHGFRYVQIEGVPASAIESIVARSVHNDLETIGTFECSNARLNQLHAAVRRTLLNSVHGMPGEEPTREKMGWTFDAGVNTMGSYLMNFDVLNTYKKYLDDLIDAQAPNGHIPPIVPTNGWGFTEKTEQKKDTTIQYDDPWWGGTIAYVADKLFERTGDTAIVKKSLPPIKKYTDFVRGTAKGHIVYWSLGDWLDLTHNSKGWGPGLTPVALTSTAANHYLCDVVARYAKIIGDDSLSSEYRSYADAIKEAFNEHFLDRTTGKYAEGSQTAQAVPLFLDMVPEDMKEKATQRLLDAIEKNDYHTSVGFIGVIPLLVYLSENGHRDIVYKMVLQEESPGWLHFVKSEKSTMGENLNAKGYGTGHHPFATNIGFWLYEYLGGLKIDRNKKENITLFPAIETDLQWAKASCNSLFGTVVSHWKKEGEEIEYRVEIPVNCTAILRLPAGFVIKDEDQLKKTSEENYIIPSGKHLLKIVENTS